VFQDNETHVATIQGSESGQPPKTNFYEGVSVLSGITATERET